MKNKLLYLVFTFFSLAAFAQNTFVEISGVIKDSTTKEALIGVSIAVKGSVTGTITDENGKFKLKTKLSFPFTLQVSYLGYSPVEYVIEGEKSNLILSLSSQTIVTNEVVVTASRKEEDIQKSPVAIDKLDIRAIRESPSPSFYDAMENVKGVQLTTSSLNFRVPNTRGFNIPNNFRFMQLVDGVDMQSATLGVPLGNAIGPNELDIESVEITPGAASALYGMNAINGMANMQSKSPFRYQGLSLYQKTGVNHVNDPDHGASILTETAIRFAKAYNNRLAFKLNASYFKGTDWISNNQTDQNPYNLTSSNPKYSELGSGSTNPAYDAWNKYGDESSNNVPVTVLLPGNPNPQQFNVRRTGYWEKDLYDPSIKNIKFDAALHYRVSEKLEVSYTYRFGDMDGTFQRGNKIRLNGAGVQNHKIELKNPWWFLRSYVSLENTSQFGNSYNLAPLASNLDLDHLGNSAWGNKFQTALQTDLNNGESLTQAMGDARKLADAGRYLPGTQAFNDLKSTIVGINNWDQSSSSPLTGTSTGGAQLLQRSRMYHTEGQYDLSRFTKKYADVLVGADFRTYQLIPDGNNFVDFSRPPAERSLPGGNDVYYTKAGGFAQVTKKLLNEKLKLQGSLRYDKNLDFAAKWNPRISAVYTLAEKHNFRVTYQNGYRFPSLFEALSYVNNVNVRRVGGLPQVDQGLGYLENSYTVASVNNYTAAVNADIANGYNRGPAALKEAGLLQQTNLSAIKPEQVNSYEIGYKSILANNTLVVDVDAYFNKYTGFLGQVDVAVPVSGNINNPADKNAVATDMLSSANQTRYRVYTNAKNTYNSYGTALRLSYNFYQKYTISGNLNFNNLSGNSNPDLFVTGFNTPKWSYNLQFGNREIVKNLGFNVVWRWQDSFLWQSPLANGTIPSYGTIDAQTTVQVPKYKLNVKIGASNLLNYRYIQYAAGPTIGALYYVSLTFDGLLSRKAD